MLEKLSNIFRIPDLRKRILFTLAMLAVYRLGGHIPTPGINADKLSQFFEQNRGTFLGFVDLFSGGQLRRLTIFALGIMPYITASIILQLLTVVYEPLAKLQKEGELGRKKITQWTRYLTVILSALQSFGIAISLTKGSNDFSVTLVAGATESEHSAIVTYVLDTTAPKVTISSPAAGATLNAPVATITGKTQARSSVVAHDTVSGASATTSAAADGTFSLTIALASGSNSITVSATDPAGNVGAATLTLKRGAGRLTAKITASAYQFSARSLPQPITLRATVTNPDGNPLAGANVTFSLSVPGVPAISTDAVTDSNGNATFTTTIPRGATAGLSGPATILVTTTSFGQTTARTTITIRK